MKRRIWITAHIALLLFLPMILIIAGFFTRSCFEDTYYGELKVLYQNLRETKGKKIVVIGNSNIAFGVDSELMEAEGKAAGLDYHVVNFGLYGTIGSKAMLDIAYDSIGEGDLVIFAPEPETLAYSLYFNGQEIWRAADSCFDLALAASKKNLGSMAGSYLAYVQDKFPYLLSGQMASASGIYAKTSFNEQGVMTASRPTNKMADGYDANNLVAYDETLLTQDFVEYLNAYANQLHKKNAQLWFSFSPVNELALEENSENEGPKRLYQVLTEQLEFPVISDPYTYILESGWFYDSNFHLNEAGMEYRSLLLIQDIKEALGINQANETQFPSMPDRADIQTTEQGELDNSDSECFTFEITGETSVITGLTETGKQRKEVVIPGEYEGHLVTAFEKNVFSQNENIEKITIQSNIQVLYDDSFEGCVHLQELILKQDTPSDIQVGYRLLNGAPSCKIYVEEQYFSSYVNDYFWGYYADGSLVKQKGQQETSEENESQVSSSTVLEKVVSQETEEIQSDKSSGRSIQIRYELNGGTFQEDSNEEFFVEEVDLTHHARANTAQGVDQIVRDGYTLIGWNTKPDGSGQQIGLGSRVTVEDTTICLYAQWAKWTDQSLFSYSITDENTVVLTGYDASDSVEELVIPQQIDGYPVDTIASGVCIGFHAKRLILPHTIVRVEKGAFSDCTFSEIMLSDCISEISDESFEKTSFDTLRINAATAPRYQSGNEICWFSDMMDQLILKQDQKKMIFFGGCSFSYGLDSEMVDTHFQNDYQIFNMGIIGGTNAVFQLECIKTYVKEGDILIHAPEVASAYQLYYVRSAENRMFRMVEGNYDLLALVDMKKLSGIFKAFSFYVNGRMELEEGSYADYCDAYNQYGDIARIRTGGVDKSYTEGYTYEIGYLSTDSLSILCDAYNELKQKGVTVFFSFSPVNKDGLTKEEQQNRVWERFEDIIRTQLESEQISVISHAEDYLYSGTFFYDTNYHLSTEGAKIRTKQQLLDLDAALGLQETRKENNKE